MSPNPFRFFSLCLFFGISAFRLFGVSAKRLALCASLLAFNASAQEAFRSPDVRVLLTPEPAGVGGSASQRLGVSDSQSNISTSHLSAEALAKEEPLNISTAVPDRHLTDIAIGDGLSLAYVEGSPVESTASQPQYSSPDSPNIHVYGESEGTELSPQQRRFVYDLRLSVRGVYDDNINISHTDRVSDFYFAIEPSIMLGLGDSNIEGANNLRFVYSPSILLFVDHSEADSVNHIIHLDAAHYFGHLSLSLAEDIAILDGTDVRNFTTDTSSTGGRVNLDVGGRTRENIYNTRLGGSYDLTGKTYLSAGVSSSITDYPNSSLFSSNSISGNLFVNYRYSDKLTVGLGGTGGHNFVDDPNPDETFEQANVRIGYVVTGKINLNASAGVEFRQFEDQSRGTYVSPVFDLSATYQMSDSTSFTLAGSRHTYNSGVLAGQDFAGNTIAAVIRQRFFQRVYVGLAAGFEINDYFETVSGIPATRHDNYFFVSPGVDLSVTRFWTVGAYYLHRQNDSSFNSFSFYDNQAGFRTKLTF